MLLRIIVCVLLTSNWLVAGLLNSEPIDDATPEKYLTIEPSPGDLDAIEKSGYRVAHSFNTDLDRYLPLAKGHFLFIETRNGKPIVAISEIEHFFPEASQGLKKTNSPISIGDTTVIFMDPARIQSAP